MIARTFCLFVCMLGLVGCSPSTEHASSTSGTSSSTGNSGQPETGNSGQPDSSHSSDSLVPVPTDNAQLEPPGKMELPKDSPVTPPQSVDTKPADPRTGGFELPPMQELEAKSQTVVAQRPVVDEPSPVAVSLQPGSVEQALQQARDAGKVCIVDFWSLGCAPCLKEFPGLVALHQKFPGDVTCISVNCDYDGRKSKPAETYRERVEAFLKANQATFKNFLCTTPSEEVYATLKTGSIPVVLVFSADGKMVKTFTDSGQTRGFTYDKDVHPLVQSLLEKGSAN